MECPQKALRPLKWSSPGLDCSTKSMYHDRSKVAGDHFFNRLNLNFVFKFLIKICNKNVEREF